MSWYGVEKAANDPSFERAAIIHAPSLGRSDAECLYLWQSRVTSLQSFLKSPFKTVREDLHVFVQHGRYKYLNFLASQAGVLFVGVGCQLLIC